MSTVCVLLDGRAIAHRRGREQVPMVYRSFANYAGAVGRHLRWARGTIPSSVY